MTESFKGRESEPSEKLDAALTEIEDSQGVEMTQLRELCHAGVLYTAKADRPERQVIGIRFVDTGVVAVRFLDETVGIGEWPDTPISELRSHLILKD